MLDVSIPNGFAAICGAPRCGTSALAAYLAEHPDVCFSRVKETHFFTKHDLSGLTDGELFEVVSAEFLPRYFGRCAPNPSLLCEGSVSYLYAPERVAQILRLWPEAKFIIAVRDPMTLLPSYHLRVLYQGDETVEDFAEAWRLSARRAAGRAVPKSCLDRRFLRYDEVAKLGTHLERFLARIGRERCHVVIHDDLVRDPATVYRSALDFLGLSDDGRREFPPVRDSRSYRVGWLQRLLKRPPVLRTALAGSHFRIRVGPLGNKASSKERLIGAAGRLRKRVLRWNTIRAHPAPVPRVIREEIRTALEDDVRKLERLLGRDLDHWLSVD